MHIHTRLTYTHTRPEVSYTRPDGCSPGSTVPALWQLNFKRTPDFVLSVHIEQVKLHPESVHNERVQLKKKVLRQCWCLPKEGFQFAGQIANSHVIYYSQPVVCLQLLSDFVLQWQQWETSKDELLFLLQLPIKGGQPQTFIENKSQNTTKMCTNVWARWEQQCASSFGRHRSQSCTKHETWISRWPADTGNTCDDNVIFGSYSISAHHVHFCDLQIHSP